MYEHEIDVEDEYKVDRQTIYGRYLAEVKVEKGTRKQYIYVYKIAEGASKLFRWFSLDRVFIHDRVLDRNGDVHNAVTKIIIDYELPLHQKAKAIERGHDLDIDYEKELKKRRERMKQQEEEAPAVKEKKEIQINDWMDEIIKNQMKELVKPKKNMTVNQYRNLPQFAGMTDEEIMKRINKR